MRRRALLLGLFSTGGQVLLLREQVASLHGDELFLGTALFGWLVAVALGAGPGGRRQSAVSATGWFCLGGILLPLSVVSARLAPVATGHVTGEAVSFVWAALISFVAMMPVGFISGRLFPIITSPEKENRTAVTTVYLLEGIGAFGGGILLALTIGTVLSTLAAALLLGVITAVLAILFGRRVTGGRILVAATGVLLAAAIVVGTPIVDQALERVRYPAYTIERVFDTPYGRQAIIALDNSLVLLTDNTVEASSPGRQMAENLLMPALAYRPEARDILLIGRSEFGVGRLAAEMPQLSLTAIDPRPDLTRGLTQLESAGDGGHQMRTVLQRFAAASENHNAFDVVILNPGRFDSYRRSAVVTAEYLMAAKSLLRRGGILTLLLDVDTDRYIGGIEKDLLGAIHGVVGSTFLHRTLWPGDMTVLLASDRAVFDIAYDSLVNRLAAVNSSLVYVTDAYLYDRLRPMRVERLQAAFDRDVLPNSLDRPILARLQMVSDARSHRVDSAIVSIMGNRAIWLVGLPAGIALFFILSLIGFGRRRFGRFLYVLAGLVSLSLELPVFYVHQSRAGSLYGDLAILIGSFMLGLAAGTWLARGARRIDRLEPGAIATLLILTAGYAFGYHAIPQAALLVVHAALLLVAAAATGAIFVAATERYYSPTGSTNRGSGYAFELLGSSVGALVSGAVLLPLIGVAALLFSMAILLLLALVGSITGRAGA